MTTQLDKPRHEVLWELKELHLTQMRGDEGEAPHEIQVLSLEVTASQRGKGQR